MAFLSPRKAPSLTSKILVITCSVGLALLEPSLALAGFRDWLRSNNNDFQRQQQYKAPENLHVQKMQATIQQWQKPVVNVPTQNLSIKPTVVSPFKPQTINRPPDVGIKPERIAPKLDIAKLNKPDLSNFKAQSLSLKPPLNSQQDMGRLNDMSQNRQMAQNNFSTQNNAFPSNQQTMQQGQQALLAAANGMQGITPPHLNNQIPGMVGSGQDAMLNGGITTTDHLTPTPDPLTLAMGPVNGGINNITPSLSPEPKSLAVLPGPQGADLSQSIPPVTQVESFTAPVLENIIKTKDAVTEMLKNTITGRQTVEQKILDNGVKLEGKLTLNKDGSVDKMPPGSTLTIGDQPVEIGGSLWESGTFTLGEDDKLNLKGPGVKQVNNLDGYDTGNETLRQHIYGHRDGQETVTGYTAMQNTIQTESGPVLFDLNAKAPRITHQETGLKLDFKNGSWDLAGGQTATLNIEGQKLPVRINNEGRLEKQQKLTVYRDGQKQELSVKGILPNLETGGWQLLTEANLKDGETLTLGLTGLEPSNKTISPQFLTARQEIAVDHQTDEFKTIAKIRQTEGGYELSQGKVALTLITDSQGNLDYAGAVLSGNSRLTVADTTEFPAHGGMVVHTGEVEIGEQWIGDATLTDGSIFDKRSGPRIALKSIKAGGLPVKGLDLDKGEFTVLLENHALDNKDISLERLELEGVIDPERGLGRIKDQTVEAVLNETRYHEDTGESRVFPKAVRVTVKDGRMLAPVDNPDGEIAAPSEKKLELSPFALTEAYNKVAEVTQVATTGPIVKESSRVLAVLLAPFTVVEQGVRKLAQGALRAIKGALSVLTGGNPADAKIDNYGEKLAREEKGNIATPGHEDLDFYLTEKPINPNEPKSAVFEMRHAYKTPPLLNLLPHSPFIKLAEGERADDVDVLLNNTPEDFVGSLKKADSFDLYVHGFNVEANESLEIREKFTKHLKKQGYKNINGLVSWSGDVGNNFLSKTAYFNRAVRSADLSWEGVAKTVNFLKSHNPHLRINTTTHSLGARLVLNAANNGVKFGTVIFLVPAVDNEVFSKGGRYEKALENIDRLVVVYSRTQKLTFGSYKAARFDRALGYGGPTGKVNHPNFLVIDATKRDSDKKYGIHVENHGDIYDPVMIRMMIENLRLHRPGGPH